MFNREVLSWIAAQVLVRQGTRILSARTKDIQTNAPRWYDEKEEAVLNHENKVPSK